MKIDAPAKQNYTYDRNSPSEEERYLYEFKSIISILQELGLAYKYQNLFIEERLTLEKFDQIVEMNKDGLIKVMLKRLNMSCGDFVDIYNAIKRFDPQQFQQPLIRQNQLPISKQVKHEKSPLNTSSNEDNKTSNIMNEAQKTMAFEETQQKSLTTSATQTPLIRKKLRFKESPKQSNTSPMCLNIYQGEYVNIQEPFQQTQNEIPQTIGQKRHSGDSSRQMVVVSPQTVVSTAPPTKQHTPQSIEYTREESKLIMSSQNKRRAAKLLFKAKELTIKQSIQKENQGCRQLS